MWEKLQQLCRKKFETRSYAFQCGQHRFFTTLQRRMSRACGKTSTHCGKISTKCGKIFQKNSTAAHCENIRCHTAMKNFNTMWNHEITDYVLQHTLLKHFHTLRKHFHYLWKHFHSLLMDIYIRSCDILWKYFSLCGKIFKSNFIMLHLV